VKQSVAVDRRDDMTYDTKGIKLKYLKLLRAFLFGSLTIILFGPPLFLTAGTLRFWNGWLFIGVFAICSVSILFLISLTNPKLAQKRVKGMEKEKPQRIVMSLLTLCALAMLAVSGFDYKYQWSRVPTQLVIVSALIMTSTFVMLYINMKENSYASRVVEIQEDQKIIDTGTYSIVRHPMYLAFSIMFCVSPIVLGSFYSLIPAICIPFLLTFRIRNEEKVLRNGLVEYETYTKKVKYRLVPFIW
jgi:protein-S-isoprenylcysteine O-methyltransferase Ste14